MKDPEVVSLGWGEGDEEKLFTQFGAFDVIIGSDIM